MEPDSAPPAPFTAVLTYAPRSQTPRLLYVASNGSVMDIDDLSTIAGMLETKAAQIRKYEAALNDQTDEGGPV